MSDNHVLCPFSPLQVSKSLDLGGKPVEVVALHYPPYIFRGKDDTNEGWTGIEVEMMNLMVRSSD